MPLCHGCGSALSLSKGGGGVWGFGIDRLGFEVLGFRVWSWGIYDFGGLGFRVPRTHVPVRVKGLRF